MVSESTQSKLPSVAMTAATVAAVSLGAVFYEKLVKEYGWEGALRYIWEGQAYTSEIQDLIDKLEAVENGVSLQQNKLSEIEAALERARRHSVDDTRTSKAMVIRWIEYYRPENLETTLGQLSDALDKLAAKVDSVTLSTTDTQSDSRVLQDIRARKKVLSKQLVLDMERCDAFIACYHVLQE